MKKPIIFFGTGRSGTTVISGIIMKHPEIAFPSQYQERFPKFSSLNYLRSTLEKKFFSKRMPFLFGINFVKRIPFKPAECYNMWNYLSGPEIDFSRNFLINVKSSEKRKVFIRKYFKTLVKKQYKERLAFKITGPSRLSYLLDIFPDAFFIHITRNPIPTISSFLNVSFWKNKRDTKLWWSGAYSDKELEWADKNSHSPLMLTTFQIKKLIDTTNQEIKNNEFNYLKVSYESFLKEPEKTIKEILDFTELSYDESVFSYLNSLEIRNKNKVDEDYFNKNDLRGINSILNSSDIDN